MVTGRLSTGAFVVLAVLGAGIGLFPPRVAAKQSSAPFTDMRGRNVDMAKPLRNVAVLAPVLSPYAAIAGDLKNVHAVSEYLRLIENNGAFRLAFPRLSSLPLLSRTGAAPDPELVLRFAPDVVLAWRVQSEALRTTGYPGLVALEWGGKDGDGKRLWEFFGKLLSDEPRAARLWQEAQSQQQALWAQLPHTKPIKVLVMSPYANGSTWIGQRGYFLNPLLQSLGAISATRDLHHRGLLGPEQILRYDPDVILVPSFVDTDDLSDVYGNPIWQSLRAVRERRVYLMPHTSAFNEPVEETPLLFWLAEILYPTLPHMARDVYRTVYADTYGRNLSDDEIDAVLHLKKNVGAFGYERFLKASAN